MARQKPNFLPATKKKLNPWDRAAIFVLGVFALLWIGEMLGATVPGAGLVSLLAFLALAYGLVRLWKWSRHSILWSLRNRLIVAYLLIAVVPLLLMLAMAGLTGYLVYTQLGAYLIYDDLQMRVARTAAIAEAAASMATPELVRGSRGGPVTPELSPALGAILSSAGATLPGIEIRFGVAEDLIASRGGESKDRFAGLVQVEKNVWLRADTLREGRAGRMVTSVTVPITEELLDQITPEMSVVRFVITRPASPDDPPGKRFDLPGRTIRIEHQLSSTGRAPAPPQNWLDRMVNIEGVSQLDAVFLGTNGPEADFSPVLAVFTAHPSQLNSRLFRSLGETGGVYSTVLILVGVVFLIIELIALRTGIGLTRTMTGAVDDLYEATQHIQAGDFSHRIRVQRRDQLGVLGESFNTMTGSISALIEEQRQRQRLENDLSIAREVQAQLFPQSIPEVEGVELAAVWRAARTVSGDYYDFFRMGPHHLGLIIADISGKGISGALLMASLQAALRSQMVLGNVADRSTAETVSRLNLHLFLNTSSDRYATLFFAIYDAQSRLLRYTNAGHLPPFYVCGDTAQKLDVGGMVVGLFEDASYEEGSVAIGESSVLVAYTDGLTEPENVYGEEFGGDRLMAEVIRNRHQGPRRLAESLIAATEEWAGTPEQADDITVIIAGMK